MAPKAVKRRSGADDKEPDEVKLGGKRSDEGTESAEAAAAGGRARKSARKDAEDETGSGAATRRSSPPPRQLRVKLVGAGNCTRQIPDAASGAEEHDPADDDVDSNAIGGAGGGDGDLAVGGLEVGDRAIATWGALSYEVDLIQKEKRRGEGTSYLVRYTRFPRRGEDWIRAVHLCKWTEALGRVSSTKQPKRGLWLEMEGRDSSEPGSQAEGDKGRNSRTRLGDDKATDDDAPPSASHGLPAGRSRRAGRDETPASTGGGGRKEESRVEEAALLHGLMGGDKEGAGEEEGEEGEEEGEEERDEDDMAQDRMDDANSLDGDSSQDEEEEDLNEDNDSELSDEEDPAKLAVEAGSISPRKGPTAPGTPGMHPGTPRRLGLSGMGGPAPMHMSLADAVKEAVHKEQDAIRHRRKGRPVKALPPPKVTSLASLREQATATYAAAWREREQTPGKAGEAATAAPVETSSSRLPFGARQRKQLCPVRSFVSVV